jgi:hypothetical protein
MSQITIACLLLCILVLLEGKVVNISNIEPRKDTTGAIMDIHDGTLMYFEGLYYYFGASYGFCKEPPGDSGCAGGGIGSCGFQTNHNVSLYVSTDLATWQFRGHVFQVARDSPLEAVMFCPKVIYNALTKLWVLWYNYITRDGGFASSYYAVATSAKPDGPFKVVNKNLTTLRYANTGDFNLFLDDNGNDAYLIYTSHITGSGDTHIMSVEKLAPNFQSTLGEKASSGYFGQHRVEAPAMFKRNGLYYTVFGNCCCYCKKGGPVTYYTSSSPLGPYRTGQVISANIPSQQTHIFSFLSPKGTQYMWQGDRWQTAPQQIKGWDFTYWQPLEFSTSGDIAPLKFTNSFVVDVDI